LFPGIGIAERERAAPSGSGLTVTFYSLFLDLNFCLFFLFDLLSAYFVVRALLSSLCHGRTAPKKERKPLATPEIKQVVGDQRRRQADTHKRPFGVATRGDPPEAYGAFAASLFFLVRVPAI
jgi:hypothetical protein